MKNKITKISAAALLGTSALTTTAISANAATTNAKVMLNGIITSPTCNTAKNYYNNPGFTLKNSVIYSGTQYSTLKMTFDKKINLNTFKNSKYYKDGASTYVNLRVSIDPHHWGTLYYNIRTNKATVSEWSNVPSENSTFDKTVYSHVTFDNNIMRITFPRKPLNITAHTQYSTEIAYDYYMGQPAAITPPYYATTCETNKYSH